MPRVSKTQFTETAPDLALAHGQGLGSPPNNGVGLVTEGSAGDPNYMASLARGLAVIQAFSRERKSLSISQISQRTGIPRAAVRRCIYTLSKLGFVGAYDERYFVLRPRVMTLGHAYLASAPLARAAQPVLKHVTNTLNEASSVAILDGNEILYIARSPASRIMTIDLDIGSRLPAHYTSMGRVMLGALDDVEQDSRLKTLKFVKYTPNSITTITSLKKELSKVRKQGYALIDQELEVDLRTIAVPIIDSEGRVVAATSVGLHAARASIEDMVQRILPILRESAAELSLLVG